VALALRKLGVVHVRPLAGGLEGWHELGYPMTPLDVPAKEL